jgi:tetratricopeptide (TPR) repeat protein
MLPFARALLAGRARSARHSLITSFRRHQRSPFQEIEEATYATHRAKGSFVIDIRKSSLFCWTLVPEERYRDLVLVADVGFGEGNGHSAVGFVLRYLDEGSFYYFLLSNRGAFRFDLALNGNHVPLIEWTRSPLVGPGMNHLRIINRGQYFGFCVDEEWVAEIEDDRIESGALGLAAQNFEDSPRARLLATSLRLDTVPRDVERAYERWARALPADPASRLKLAETLAAMGVTEAAIVQLNTALRDRAGTPEEYGLLGRLYLAAGLYPRALEAVDRALAAEPHRAECLLEKAEILYAMNRLTECRDLASAATGIAEASAPLAMVLGNAEYALGNWPKAADAYLVAWERERAPLAALNAARSFDRQGDGDRALELYVAAADAYYRREGLAELEALLAEMERSHAGRPEVRSLKARLLFWRGEEDAAAPLLDALVAEGVEDSAVHYLDGLLLARRGRRAEASRCYERAVELEPGAPLYWFRLAEARHLAGQEADAALGRALELAPGDPWSNNLRGQILAERGELEAAEDALVRAAEGAPDAPDIVVNLADVLRRRCRWAESLAVLDRAIERLPASHALVNQRGNVLAAEGDVAGAHAAYERALVMSPGNPDYLENCARVCLEQDLVLRAEECLARLLETRPTPAAYALMGSAAAIRLQYDRAEASFREGLRLDPVNADLLASLVGLLVARGDYGGARGAADLLDRAAAASPDALAKAIRAREKVRARFEERIRCNACSREWWVPRELEAQPALRARGDPPDNAPVGSCPECGGVYCAACAKASVVGSRFTCPACSVPLKMTDPRLAFLFRQSVDAAGGSAAP